MAQQQGSDQPWYHEGLAFECTQCGNCCTGGEGYVWLTNEEIEQIADYLDKPVGEVRLIHCRPVGAKISLREYRNGDCIYFDPHKRCCTIYPVRPVQCRTWPFWPPHLKSRQTWNALKQNCPGINQGELVQLEVIEDRKAQTAFLHRD